MPNQINHHANSEAFDRLIKEQKKPLKQLVDQPYLKTLQRARKGARLNPVSFQYFARIFGVEMSELWMEEDQPASYERTVSIQLRRTESLKGFPKDFFESSDPELIVPPEVDARFEIDDPKEDQTEIAAQLSDMVESLAKPQNTATRQKASTKIRSYGRLNGLIKKLIEDDIHLFLGRYEYRHGAWPWIDADQSEIAKEVIIDRLLLVFSANQKSSSISRQVDQGMSLDALTEDVEWMNGELKAEAKNELDELGARFLKKRRKESRKMLIDFRI